MHTIALIYRKRKNGYSIENLFKPFDNLAYIKRVELPKKLNSFTSFLIIFIFLLKVKQKIIHITGDVQFVAFLLFWKTSILTIHDLNYLESLNGFKRWIYAFIWFYLPLLCCNKIVVISPFTKKQLRKHFNVSEDKIEIIPNFYYPYEFLDNKNTNDDFFRILSIGTQKNKNLIRLISAIEKIENVKLTLVGNQKIETLNKLKSSEINYVLKSNLSIAELESEYNLADILFYASTKEGFGLPILEAQSSGLPVITSNTTSMPYVAGDAAILINPYSLDEIITSIVSLKNNKAQRADLQRKGFANVKRFTKENYIESYRKIHESFIKKILKSI